MTNSKTFDIRLATIADDFRKYNTTSIGYDTVFERLGRMMNEPTSKASNYPPYNIRKISDNEYSLEIAVAGFMRDELCITVKKNLLTVESNIKTPTDLERDDEYLYKGIATRAFQRQFNLADNVEVASAETSNGMLYICLKHVIPEKEKLRNIEILTKM
jgi:molecular chaperone IbpA